VPKPTLPVAITPYEFDWPVDQSGYDIERRPAPDTGGSTGTILSGFVGDQLRRRGGPLRYYRPMENPALWRRFADTCVAADGALAFVSEFGLLTEPRRELSAADTESLDRVLNTARLLRLIAHGLDQHDRAGAAIIFNTHAHPRLSTEIVVGAKGRLENKLVPISLRSALLIQASEAITSSGRQFRRCKNCPEWFVIGAPGRRRDREYCSNACRLAWFRKQHAHTSD